MNQLIQRKNFITVEYKIQDNKLTIFERKFGNETEVEYLYENLGGTKKSEKNAHSYLILIGCAAMVISICSFIFSESTRNALWGGFFWLFVSLVALVYYFIGKENLWKIETFNQNAGALIFHKQIPNEAEVATFVDKLIQTRNSYLKIKYARIDKNLSYENQYAKLEWLKGIEAISMQEFIDLHEQLKETTEPLKRKVGFES